MAQHDKRTTAAMAELDHDAQTTWIYQHRLQYRTTADIAAMTGRPAIRDEQGRFSLDGGLGKRMSASTVRRRVLEAAKAHTEELAELVPEYRAVSLARLDQISAAATAQLARALQRCGYVYTHNIEWGQVVLDDKAEAVVTNALRTLANIEEQRRKMLGLDAPVEVNVTVEHYDAEALELQAMLDAAAGHKAKAKR
jgi:hypothetical protein